MPSPLVEPLSNDPVDSEESDDEIVEDVLASGSERLADVLRLLPAQDAPSTGHRNLKIKRAPGRPRRVERAPQVSDLEYHAAMVEARQRFIDSDSLVRAVEERADPIEILFQVKSSVAREASSLAFDQVEAQKRGRETAQTSSRRIEALKKIAEIELKLRELQAESVNFASERFQKVFAFFVQKLTETAEETLAEESRDLFLNRFASAMENWEEEASAIANNSKK